jgi:GMP synthase (glutamine-hydrolysing)
MQTLVVQNDALCPLGELARTLHAAGPVHVWEPSADGTPPSPGGYDAVVALGGGQSPTDDAGHAWLAQERTLLDEAVADGVAVLGLCLGAELLAQVLGARVRALPRPDVGWRRLQTTAAAAGDALLGRLQGARVLQWHSYAFTLPRDAILLAGSEERADAFRHGPACGRCSSTAR